MGEFTKEFTFSLKIWLTFPKTSSEHTTKWKPVKCTCWCECEMIRIRYFCISTGCSNQFKFWYATSSIAETLSMVVLPKCQTKNDYIRPQTKQRMSIPRMPGSKSDWNSMSKKQRAASIITFTQLIFGCKCKGLSHMFYKVHWWGQYKNICRQKYE